jgi:hypothetical protein
MECYEVADSIHGYRIRAEARKIGDPHVIAKTGRHKAQRIILRFLPITFYLSPILD